MLIPPGRWIGIVATKTAIGVAEPPTANGTAIPPTPPVMIA
jgi:hypothetical protein